MNEGSKFPQSTQRGEFKETYNYMNYKNDEIQVDIADLKRRNSMPNVRIGA
jgi:hypothetical protein